LKWYRSAIRLGERCGSKRAQSYARSYRRRCRRALHGTYRAWLCHITRRAALHELRPGYVDRIYGSTTLKEIEASCQALAEHLGVSVSFHQSNIEGELVNLIQSAHGKADAIIMNPAAYSFTSIALIDSRTAPNRK
jgi:hypothetical protein